MDFVDGEGLRFEIIVDPMVHPQVILKLIA